uniref:Uncharacterized protein n=1 Tax=Vitrella brassicaformis TaxID=1169539 RepID=A0A7S1JWG3_9ALVE|mmetsp:Transcript_27394/g.68380  ORF Transcript_27394/g.68380 Transcript_27394/m.68380 type:complete len:140 (+) Transcript_27394:169-588(+)
MQDIVCLLTSASCLTTTTRAAHTMHHLHKTIKSGASILFPVQWTWSSYTLSPGSTNECLSLSAIRPSIKLATALLLLCRHPSISVCVCLRLEHVVVLLVLVMVVDATTNTTTTGAHRPHPTAVPTLNRHVIAFSLVFVE